MRERAAMLAVVVAVACLDVGFVQAGPPSDDEYRLWAERAVHEGPEELSRETSQWETSRLRGLADRLRRGSPSTAQLASVAHLQLAQSAYDAGHDRRAADHIGAGLACLGLRPQDGAGALAGRRRSDAGPVGSLGIAVPGSVRRDLQPLARQWLLTLAYWLQSRLLPEPAASAFAALLSANPDDGEALLGAGTVQELLAFPANLVAGDGGGVAGAASRAARAQAAETSYQRVLEIDPHQAEARVRLGRVLLERGDLPTASDQLTRVLEGSDAHASWLAHLLLGRLSESEGHLDVAVAHYRAASDLEPRHQAAHLALSHALFRSGSASSAKEILVDAFGDPFDGSPDGWAAYQMGLVDRLSVGMATLRSMVQP